MMEPNPAAADICALLWAYQFNKELWSSTTEVTKIAQNPKTHSITWIHLRYDAPDATVQMKSVGLDEAVIDALCADETRPRMMPLKDGTLLILRGINLNPNADPEDMISLRIWFNDSLMITARKRDRVFMSIEALRDSLSTPLKPNTLGGLLITLVEKIADRVGDMVDTIEEELTLFETNSDSLSHDELRRRLADARRQSASIRRYIGPQRDALDALYRSRSILSDAEAHLLREQTDRTTRYVEDLDLARERSIVLQEELRSQIAEQQNIRMYVLSIITAIFLPLSFLTGVFGMNVAGLPGTENSQSFLYLATGMSLLALGTIGLMFWRRWL